MVKLKLEIPIAKPNFGRFKTKHMIKRVVKPYFIHIIVWGLLFVLPFVGYLYQPNKFNSIDYIFLAIHCINLLFFISIFYLNLNYIAPNYLFKKARVYFLFVGLGLVFFLLLNQFYGIILDMEKPQQPPKKSNEGGGVIFFRYFIPSIIYFIFVLISTMLYLYNAQVKQKEINQLTELEKTATELNMLKLQISPHFLFNTLNNIRWLVRKKSEQSEESILKLSEILRYIIYEVGNTKVEISREVEHLRNYIELQTLRLPKQGEIKFEVSDKIHSQQIEPLLFIHFVENAFKYGIDSKNSPEITIMLEKTADGIHFRSRNKILSRNTTLENSGIGLTNIQRRLALLYPEKHQLTISDDGNYFEVNLFLNLD